MPQHKNPCPGFMKSAILVDPFIGHHYYILGLSDLCFGVEHFIK